MKADKYIISALAFSFFFFAGISQNKKNFKKDSLENLLKTQKGDTARVNTLNNLADEIKNNYSSSLTLAREAFFLADKLKFEKGKCRAALLTGTAMAYMGRNDSSLFYLSMAVRLCGKNQTVLFKARCHNSLGIYHEIQMNLPEALREYKIALSIRQEAGDKKSIASSNYNIANILRYQGNYPEALKYHLSALKLNEELDFKTGMGMSYNSVGILFRQLKNYSSAMDYHKKAYALYTAENDERNKGFTLNHMGLVWRNTGSPDKARECYLGALRIFEKLEYLQGISDAHTNIGNVFRQEREFDKALEHFKLVLQMEQQSNDNNGLAAAYGNVSSIYIEQNKIAEALKTGKLCLKHAEQSGIAEYVLDAERNLYDIYNITKDYKAALGHYKKYISLRDSLTNEENTRKEVQLQMQYEFSKKTTADSIQIAEAKKLELLKFDQEISRQKTYTYTGIGGLLVMMITAGISYSAFRNKRKANVEIKRQKDRVEEKQKEILDSIHYAKRIQTTLMTSEKYFTKHLNKLNKRN